MTINGIEINLKKIGIDFMLNEDQVGALNHLANFLEDKNSISTTLCGSAGTGKTACTKVLLEYINIFYGSNMQVTLAAPTHKAKIVLKRLSGGEDPTTVHKLLGLKPVVDIAEFDARDIQFIDDFILDFLFDDVKKLMLIDEASLINNVLFDLIIEKLGKHAKIIFLGDAKQLAPVKQEDLSKVFNSTDYPGFELTKVERQSKGNPLLATLSILRDRHIFISDFETSEGEKAGLYVHKDTTEFLRAVKQGYIENPIENKTICFTNQRVNQFNLAIRKILGRKSALEVGETLIGLDNHTPTNTYSYRKKDESFAKVSDIYNGNDYILIDMIPSEKQIPFYRTMSGYDLILLDTVDNKKHVLFIIDPEAEFKEYEDLAGILERTRLKAIDKTTPYMSRKTYWQSWFAMNKSFGTFYDLIYDGRVVRKATLGYGYAITIHRSQGSTYNNVFVDMKDIFRIPNKDALRSLQYVALSRAREKVYLLC